MKGGGHFSADSDNNGDKGVGRRGGTKREIRREGEHEDVW